MNHLFRMCLSVCLSFCPYVFLTETALCSGTEEALLRTGYCASFLLLQLYM